MKLLLEKELSYIERKSEIIFITIQTIVLFFDSFCISTIVWIGKAFKCQNKHESPEDDLDAPLTNLRISTRKPNSQVKDENGEQNEPEFLGIKESRIKYAGARSICVLQTNCFERQKNSKWKPANHLCSNYLENTNLRSVIP
uniref:Uncharacterized protein n=1 Tax=Glossina brevipalpis TaxID=37001 RepID=A0A1A9WQN5_9MUSC